MKQCKTVVFAIAVLLITIEGFAQKRNSKSRKSGTSSSGYGNTGSSSGYGNPGSSSSGYGNTGTSTNSGYGTPAGTGTKQSTNNSGYGNTGSGAGTTPAAGGAQNALQVQSGLPITVIKGNGSGIGDSVPPSLRNDNIIERNLVKERVPIVYEHIREDDAVYRQRVWREIDTREKMNLPFRYAAKEDAGDQHFINILYNSIQSGDVTVFSGDDDRFTTPLTKEEVAKIITGGMDTAAKYDMNGDVIGYEVRSRMVEPDSIYRFRLKEEWVFDKESSRMFVRILGIAPIMNKYSSSGMLVAPDLVLFWAYYPDLRPTLAKFEVYNGKNFSGRMSWEELFESRFFTSYITKSTIDNPYDQSLKQYIKDPLFRLLEGENIKERIFNYEQDLWSY